MPRIDVGHLGDDHAFGCASPLLPPGRGNTEAADDGAGPKDVAQGAFEAPCNCASSARAMCDRTNDLVRVEHSRFAPLFSAFRSLSKRLPCAERCAARSSLFRVCKRKRRQVAASESLRLAGATGLEPATSGVTGRRANDLCMPGPSVYGRAMPLDVSRSYNQLPNARTSAVFARHSHPLVAISEDPT